jgi:hypothetical protein
MKTLLLLPLALLSDSVIIKDKIVYFERDGFEQVTTGDTTRIIFTGVKPYISWQEMINLMNDTIKK